MRILFVLLILLSISGHLSANNRYSLPNSKLISGINPITCSRSEVLEPFDSTSAISGVAVSGYIIKESPDYAVRIILTDKKGKEYLDNIL